MNTWVQADPVNFVSFATGLFEHGIGRFGAETRIEPGSDLMDQDYAKIVPMMAGNVTPQGDWMVLSALRDSENMLVDYEGTPSGDWPGSPDGTMDLEIIKWLKACGAFKTVENKSGYFTDTLADAMALVPTSSRLIILNVNADMLYSTTPIPTISRSNHFVALRSNVVKVGTTTNVKFKYWTWGDKPKTITMTEERFLKFFGGGIVAEKQ
jgi:hypothetical protein